ncbi:hypothetical protein [Planomonospora sphaerica]|uniref:hypothetical protein n=1 Tax=Planomonospora sphaerica TaxID=161355 RepID=UPI00083A5D74|nr:hypothetical protein [Planomonospora sphaerica]
MTTMLTLIAALTAGTGGTAGASSACSCAERTPRQLVEAAEVVFSATATDVRVGESTLGGGSVTAVLHTDHVYKGEPGAESAVFTRAHGSACGYEFVEGRRYLVFADVRDSRLVTTLCSGNRLLPAGDEPLRLSDRTQGRGPLTSQLITALGEPTRADTEPAAPVRTGPVDDRPAPASGRTGLMVIAVAVGAVMLTGIMWTRRRARAGRRD